EQRAHRLNKIARTNQSGQLLFFRAVDPAWTSAGRLLLRCAMDGAQPPDEIAAVDAYHFTAGKNAGENIQGNAVLGIVEGRNQDQVIGDVEVGVAGRQPPPFEYDRTGKRQFHDLQLTAFEVGSGAQAGEIFLQQLIIGIAASCFDRSEHRVRSDKAGDV